MTKYTDEWVDIRVKVTRLNARVKFLEKIIERLEGEIRSLGKKLSKEKEDQEAKRFKRYLLFAAILGPIMIAVIELLKMLL